MVPSVLSALHNFGDEFLVFKSFEKVDFNVNTVICYIDSCRISLHLDWTICNYSSVLRAQPNPSKCCVLLTPSYTQIWAACQILILIPLLLIFISKGFQICDSY